MSRRDDKIRLQDMLTHAREAVDLCRGRTHEQLASDRTLTLAVTRLVHIVGEAASHVSENRRRQIEGVAWPQIVGMRNRLVHAYHDVDLAILWDTIQIDLPDLIACMERALPSQ